MKSYNFKLFLCLLTTGLVTTFSFGQSAGKATITLVVDLANLGDDPNDPGGCTFEVDSGTSGFNFTDPKEFTIHVPNGTKIKWQGRTTTGENVRILKIQYKSGVEVFGKEKIRRCLFGKRVRKTTKNSTGEGYYVYEIKFRPKNMERYYLDPKIKVN